jgi:hypothetical protein
MRTHTSWLFLLVASNAACLRHTEFKCSTDADCSGGTCESVGYCSVMDSNCSSGHRFGDSAGPFAGQCVGEGGGDAGPDTPVDSGVDTSTPGCPMGYVATGPQGHMYKIITAIGDWQTRQDMCVATKPGAAYLAIPDDDVEFLAINALTGITPYYWLGIKDVGTEMYMTVKNTPQTYLPWDTGQPAPEPPSKPCVMAISGIDKFASDKCNQTIAAVCECEP